MKDPKEKYRRRRETYGRLIEKQERAVNLISKLRLFDAAAAVISFIVFYRSKNYYIAWGTTIVYCLIFIYLVVIHNRAKRTKDYISALHRINDTSLMRFSDEWKLFSDTGEEFKDEKHPFSQDLDIFGKGSLFQWINTANTNIGRNMLKRILSEPCSQIEEIKMRQDAVNELSRLLWWRQRFALEGMVISKETKNEEDLFKWAGERNKLYNKYSFIMCLRIMPIVIISTLILSYGIHLIPNFIFSFLAIIHFGMLFLWGSRRNKALETVYKYKNNIKLYSKMLKHFEEGSFKSPYLKIMQERLLNSKGQRASKQIKRLERIAESISNRNNIMFLPLNVLFLWDYQCMTALEKWKEQSGDIVRVWLESIGEMEALSSLGVIRHDNPEWTIPDFTEIPGVFRARSMGHPLLTGRQVYNDVTIDEPTRALLITGSNMSGKSTLLRTSGINLILAYAGAPVCADCFKCSIMNVYTCMRISDNLEKNISSFYAELLRIKDILNAAREKGHVFFLLDEIFKGTNSQDRHTGAKVLIEKLCGLGAVGLVSTHDLELGEMEEESSGRVKNYHFQEYYKENQIYFDYKLRSGISKTRNALYLMKMIGIDTDSKIKKED